MYGTWRAAAARGGCCPTIFHPGRRWIDAGCFEVLVADVQLIVREWAGRKGRHDRSLHRQPHTAI